MYSFCSRLPQFLTLGLAGLSPYHTVGAAAKWRSDCSPCHCNPCGCSGCVAVLLYWHLGDCCWLEVALVTSAEMDPLQLWDEQLTRVMSLSLGDELVSAVIVVAAVNVVR